MSSTPAAASLSPSATAALAALDAAPGSTVSKIAALAGIGASTAANALKALERLDLAHRAIGGYEDNRRLPDHWFPGPSEGQTAPGPEAEVEDSSRTVDAAAEVPEEGDDMPGHEETGRGGPSGEESAPLPVPEVDAAGAGFAPQPAEDGPDASAPGQDPASLPAMPDETVSGPTVAPGAACPTCGHRRPAVPVRNAWGGGRLGQGQLHQLVVDHLRAHPGQEWTATGVAKVIGRSSGAIANALAAMVTRGEAEMTCSVPRRFRALALPQQMTQTTGPEK